jgi:cystathionine beta-lyase/cystathionine gamma-synthase
MGGVVIGGKKLVNSLASMGATMDPHQAWLLNRSLATLPMRLRQHSSSAIKIALFLESHPNVERVLYPGLPTHPDHELGKKQMSGFSSLFSFTLKDPQCPPTKVLSRLKLIKRAWSYGGAASLAMAGGDDLKSRLAKRGMQPGLIRLHIGFEDPAAIMEDLDNALKDTI